MNNSWFDTPLKNGEKTKEKTPFYNGFCGLKTIVLQAFILERYGLPKKP